MKLTVLPLTPERWPDLETVFGAKGCSIARYCWCMAYRRTGSGSLFNVKANRAQLKSLVDGGNPPGLIGYRNKTPVGWISLGPREEFARLQRSPIMRPVDDKPVWSVVCFVVPSEHRKQGVARALLRGAITYARKRGARILEAYPVDKKGPSSDGSLWFGAKSMYDHAGFTEVARRKATRPVVRLKLK